MNVSAATSSTVTPIAAQTGASAEPASGAAAPVSSFDAMLAAVPPPGAPRGSAAARPSAQDKSAEDGDKGDSSPQGDAPSPDLSQAVALVVVPAVPQPPAPPAIPPSGDASSPVSRANAVPAALVTQATPALQTAAVARMLAADVPAGTPNPDPQPEGNDGAVPGGASPASTAGTSPVASAGPIVLASPADQAAPTVPAAPTASVAPVASAAPAASPKAPASAKGPASAKPGTASKANGPTTPAAPAAASSDVAAIDLDALFPRGSDKPLNVTFTGSVGATASAPPPAASAIAATPAAALAQAAAAPLASPSATVPGSSTADPRDGAAAPAAGDKSDAASSAAPDGAPAPAPAAVTLATNPHATPDASATLGAAPASSADAAFQHHLNLAQDGAWLDGLARDIARSADGSGALSFRISPERLGTLHVALSTGADGTSIRLTADTAAAHAVLTDSRHALIAQAETHGMRVADARIDLASSTGGQAFSGGQSPSGGQAGGGGRDARTNLLTILPQTGAKGDGISTQAPRHERYA